MAFTVTPLRYPGGKSQLFKKISMIIMHNELIGCKYVEPFAGGSGLALKLLFEGIVKSIVLNDIDYNVYCFWKTITSQPDELIKKINDTKITQVEWGKQREIYKKPKYFTQNEVAFSTLFLNRTNVSGILRGGMIGGKEQAGKYKLDARFNKAEIIQKIKKIYAKRFYISLYNLDAQDFIKDIIPTFVNTKTLINFDPPYVKKGARLYKNFYGIQDHEKLEKAIEECNMNWIVTYDECDFIKKLYEKFYNESICLNYCTGENKKGTEILVYGPSIKPAI